MIIYRFAFTILLMICFAKIISFAVINNGVIPNNYHLIILASSLFVFICSMFFISIEASEYEKQVEEDSLIIQQRIMEKLTLGGVLLLFFIVDLFIFNEKITMIILALFYSFGVVRKVNKINISKDLSFSVNIAGVDSGFFKKQITEYLDHYHILLSGQRIIQGKLNPFVYGFNVDKNIDLSEITYTIFPSDILIEAPRKKIKSTLTDTHLIINIPELQKTITKTVYMIKEYWIILLIPLVIFLLSVSNNLFVLFISSLMVGIFIFNEDNEEFDNPSAQKEFSKSQQNSSLSIDGDLNKKVQTLNDLIEESFFEGSTIKEQIKKEVQNLIETYELISKYQDTSSTSKLEEQKRVIENSIDSFISELINKKVSELNIEQKINNVKSNFEVYSQFIKNIKGAAVPERNKTKGDI